MSSSILRSTNCNKYTNTLSVFVETTAAHGTAPECKVALPPTFSCQRGATEKPDAATEQMLRERAAQALRAKGCLVRDPSKIEMTHTTNQIGTQEMEYSAERLVKLGMTSNCFREGNDPNHATHRATARCFPMYDMTDKDGKRVRNTNMQILSNLAVCDLSDEAMPQVQEDLRRVAAHNAAANGYTVDRPEDLACNFSVLPLL